MTPVLALDLATSTGWAARDRSGVVTSGTQVFELRRGESAGMRFLRFRRWLKEIIELNGIGRAGRAEDGNAGLLAYEQAHHRGGHATSLCVGLVTVLIEEAAAQGCETSPVHTSTLKKHATGKGNAGKTDMQAAALKRWGPPASGELQEDQADALCVLGWALDEIGERA